MDLIAGVVLTPLNIIGNPKGNIMHALKRSEDSFDIFGEAYYSFCNFGEIKGWKRHKMMTLNITVPVGKIKFVLYDDRINSASLGRFNEIILGKSEYQRLTVPPLVWMSFEGCQEGENLLLNIANIEHTPDESENRELDEIHYSR